MDRLLRYALAQYIRRGAITFTTTRGGTDDGLMVLHSIGRSSGPDVTSPWITRYIFLGDYIPAVSEVVRAGERAGRGTIARPGAQRPPPPADRGRIALMDPKVSSAS